MGNRKSIIRSRRAEQVSRQVEQKWAAYLSTLSERYGLILGSSSLETGECWLRPPWLGGQLPMQFPRELQRVNYEEFVHFVHCNGYCPTCKAGHLLPTFAPYSWAQNDGCRRMVWGRKRPGQRIYPDRGMLAVGESRVRPRKMFSNLRSVDPSVGSYR